jgi:hypothetical protein
MLRANPTPFETTWVNFGLGSLRVRGGTYKHWAYDSIPDLLISEIRGEFQYMIPNSEVASRRDYMESHRQNFEQMLREAREQGIRLPSDFVRLMQDLPRLENSPRSPTDCGFAFPDEYKSIRASPSGEGMHIHFYCDSQSCVLWDLYIHPMGGHCVIARDSDYFDPMPPEPLEPVRDGPRAWFVAPSFEAFVYRIWLENQIWYLEHSDSYQKMAGISAQAAPAIHAYVNHYRQQSSRDK